MDDDFSPPDDQQERPFEAFDTTIEQFVIGWALREPAAIAWAMAIIGPNDFYHDLHQRVFERICAKHAADRPVTPATIAAAMRNDARLLELGGVDYLVELSIGAPSRIGHELQVMVEDHARTIREFRNRRDAIDASYSSWLDLQTPMPISDALAPVVQLSDREAEQADFSAGSIMVVDAASQLFADLESHDAEKDRQRAVSTGIQPLDDVIGGVVPKNLMVAGGRPGMGKSILGTTIALAAAGVRREFGKVFWLQSASTFVDYFSLEMTAPELTARMLCDLDYDQALAAGIQPVHYSLIQLRRVTNDQLGRLAEANLHLSGLPIEIHDRDRMTIDDIAAIVRAKQASNPGPRTVIIDHMHLIEPSDRYRGRKVDEIGEITRGAKRMAKRLDVGVVLLAQLNREVERREDKMPNMADFRDAGSIEQDADCMVGLNRPEYWLGKAPSNEDDEARGKRRALLVAKANIMEIGIMKNRHGASDQTVSVFCDVAASVIRGEKPLQGAAAEITQGRMF